MYEEKCEVPERRLDRATPIAAPEPNFTGQTSIAPPSPESCVRGEIEESIDALNETINLLFAAVTTLASKLEPVCVEAVVKEACPPQPPKDTLVGRQLAESDYRVAEARQCIIDLIERVSI